LGQGLAAQQCQSAEQRGLREYATTQGHGLSLFFNGYMMPPTPPRHSHLSEKARPYLPHKKSHPQVAFF
jgi:hypothetical protein